MDDLLLPTEIDEMTRAFDPNNTDSLSADAASAGPADRLIKGAGRAGAASSPPISPARRSTVHLTVCPFCGSVNESVTGPCRQCGMENTQSTRQATRSKIGPWFVWQSRNPSAPGMNWATLLSLVEKGRITPRSVVRGPTTGQLWRFAARVKGISREFGACWHCGGELNRAARLCTSCKRLQQPPINPDALLETSSDASFAPIHKAVGDASHTGHLNPGAEPVRREAPMPSPPPYMGASGSVGLIQPPPPTDAPIDPTVPVIDMGETAMPSGMEFRAFQMEGDAAPAKPPRGALRRILLAAVLTAIAVVPVLYFNPQVRPHYVKWYQHFLVWVKNLSTHPPAPASRASHQEVVPVDPPSATRSGPTPLLSVPVQPPVAPPPVAQKLAPLPDPDVEIGPAKGTVATMPTTAKAPEPSVRVEGPLESQTAERRSWELYERAIKSEQREDYGSAVKEYEWIAQLRLPEGAGPSDVESRLQRARALLKQRSN